MPIPLNGRSLDYARDDKGEAALSFSFEAWEDEQQVPPMRYAPEFLALLSSRGHVLHFSPGTSFTLLARF
jgi:hypothetical protein